MIKMVNFYSGGTTYVAEGRLAEYIEAGYRIAEEPKKPEPAESVKPKKRTEKK